MGKATECSESLEWLVAAPAPPPERWLTRSLYFEAIAATRETGCWWESGQPNGLKTFVIVAVWGQSIVKHQCLEKSKTLTAAVPEWGTDEQPCHYAQLHQCGWAIAVSMSMLHRNRCGFP